MHIALMANTWTALELCTGPPAHINRDLYISCHIALITVLIDGGTWKNHPEIMQRIIVTIYNILVSVCVQYNENKTHNNNNNIHMCRVHKL